MSRIGKLPIAVPAGVTVTVNGNNVHVKGPKGELERTISNLVEVKQEGEQIILSARDESKEANAQHGLSRTLVNNMVLGVTNGFEKRLELVGVGYRAALQNNTLTLSLGYSHPVVIPAPEGIEFQVPDNTHIVVRGMSKETVGQIAAVIRSKRPPEPYKAKGIRYEGEYIRRKLGKAAG